VAIPDAVRYAALVAAVLCIAVGGWGVATGYDGYQSAQQCFDAVHLYGAAVDAPDHKVVLYADLSERQRRAVESVARGATSVSIQPDAGARTPLLNHTIAYDGAYYEFDPEAVSYGDGAGLSVLLMTGSTLAMLSGAVIGVAAKAGETVTPER